MYSTDPGSPRHPHDKFFKAVFSNAAYVREILEAQAPDTILQTLRLDTISHTNVSFVDEQLDEHFADVVLECHSGDYRHSATVSLILEHKSSVPGFAPLQLMRYQINGWRHQIRQDNPRPTPIIPVLFYHGEESWHYKAWPQFLHGWHDAFEQFTPKGEYILVDLSEMSDEHIMKLRSRFLITALLLMKHRKEKDYLLQNLPKVFNFVENDLTDDRERVENLKIALKYLRSLKTISLDDIKSKLQFMQNFNQVWDVLADERAEGFDEGIGIGIEKGIDKGIDIGIDKGVRKVISSLILKMPEADDALIADLSSQPIEIVAQVRRESENHSSE